jgi:hypothetical protein
MTSRAKSPSELARALRDGGQVHARRGRHAEARGVVLGHVVEDAELDACHATDCGAYNRTP